MKNKSTLTLFTFFLSFSICLVASAQKLKSNNDFTLSVLKYSDNPNFEKEHIHVLELKNNSMQISEYAIKLVTENCSEKKKYNSQSIKSTENELMNIKTQMFLNDSNGKEMTGEVIQLNPNDTVKLYLKTQQNSNAVLDSWNCTNIVATKLLKNKIKSSSSKKSELVVIKTFVRNPNNKGH